MVDWETFNELESLVKRLKTQLRIADKNILKFNRYETRMLTYDIGRTVRPMLDEADRLWHCLLTEHYGRQESKERRQ